MALLKTPGQVITFYSYKGGTGRTMALANVACLLAKREDSDKPILMVDWDLEAPGLHRFFYGKFQRRFTDSKDFDLHPGLIDLFQEFDNATEAWRNLDEEQIDEETAKLLDNFWFENFILETDIANLYLLKAGRFDEDYSRKINEFKWVRFYQKAPELIRFFAEQLTKRYQYILIDSRTGVTDTSGICTMLMPEKLVAVFTPNRQSLLGVLDQVVKATRYRRQSDDLRPLVVFPLPSRIEPAEPGLRDKWRFGSSEEDVQGYQQEFERIFTEVYGLSQCNLSPYFDEIQIQHIPRYAYGEQIAVLIERTGDRLSLAQSYEKLTRNLINLSSPWELHKSAIDETVVSLPEQPRICPYPGLAAFREEDAPFFFGRTKLLELLLERIRRENFLVVIGASGSGTSSLVNAGLIPAIKSGHRIADSEQWQVGTFSPGSHPLQSLALALISSDESGEKQINRLQEIEKLLDSRERGLESLVKIALAPRVLLVIDQLEEIFTLCQSQEERQKFFELLLSALKHTDKLRVVVTLRADFLEKCVEQDYSGLGAKVQDGVIIVPPMTRQELQKAITEPAKQVGLTVEPDLVERLVSDVEGASGGLPLLQYTLVELWQRRTDNSLTLASYLQLGGLQVTLDKRATEVYQSLSVEEQKVARMIFLQLVQLGEGTEDTRKQVSKQDLMFPQYPNELVERVLNKLVDAKLIVISETLKQGDDSEQGIVVNLAHEALIRYWSLMRQWLASSRNVLRTVRKIEAGAQEWLSADKTNDISYLLQGSKLIEVEHLLQKNTEVIPLTIHAQEYIRFSRIKVNRRKQQTRIIIAACFISLLAVSIIQTINARNLSIQSIKADTSSSTAYFALNRNTLDGLIKAIETGRLLQQSFWFNSNSLLKAEVMQNLSAGVYWTREYNRLEGHQNFVQSVSFSPDGQLIATASFDGTAKVWQADGKLLHTLAGHTQPVVSVSFSPNNSIIATASLDGTVKLWNRDGKLISSLESQTGPVRSVSFSPDGQTIATAGDDGLVKLWTREGTFLKDLNGHNGEKVYSVRFSPDGKTIASASRDKTVILWDAKNGQPIRTLRGHQALVYSVSFSPDSRTIATASHDGTVILWNRDTGTRQQTLPGQSDQVNDVDFSPNGQTIAAATASGTVKLWDRSGRLLDTFEGHQGTVNSISFSPDGMALASASDDGTVKLWRVSPLVNVLAKHDASVLSVAFSRDGQLIATAGLDNAVQIRKSTGELLTKLEGRWVSFSPDGQTIATIVGDTTVKLWNRAFQPVVSFAAQSQPVNYLAFSSDGQLVATASSDGTVKFWNLKGEPQGTSLQTDTSIYSVAFNSDGKTIATGDEKGTVILWNRDGTRRSSFKAHDAQIFNLQFASNDNRLVTVSGDKTAKIWDQNGQLLHILGGTDGHTAGISGVSFSSDGRTIATASDDRTVKLWTQEGQLITTLIGHSGPVNSVSFSPDGNTLITASSDQTVLLWPNIKDLSIDNLLLNGCDWLRDYLTNNPNAPRNICTL